MPVVPRRRLSPEEQAAQEANATQVEMVKVVVPKAFMLTHDHHHRTHYAAGVQEMPKEHFENWWTKANGVELA